MAQISMPYQSLERAGNLLVAARGSDIDLFSLGDGSYLSTWKSPIQDVSTRKSKIEDVNTRLQDQSSTKAENGDKVAEGSTPPAKRRKLSTSVTAEPMSEENNQKVTNGEKQEKKQKQKQNNRSHSLATGLDAPAVIALAVTKNAQHVVAITGEDKSIRVFSITEEDGTPSLLQLSRRSMPKRPSALAITEDDTTIISADKFGDVYSIPLTYSSDPVTAAPSESSISTIQNPDKLFKPSANELTIHSQRNRKALESQRKQKAAQAEKSGPVFEHTLLLGHVSLLTDIKLAKSNGRHFLLSADRDEHIRVSRGIPQTHVIENFCLGHKEFISRICIPETRPEVLISGGGDDDLYVWEWENGELVSKAELKKHVVEVLGGKMDADEIKELKIAVSGISSTSITDGLGVIIVSVEGIPALFTFTLTASNVLDHHQTLVLPGNVISFVVQPYSSATGSNTRTRIIVSMDNIHIASSTTELRDLTNGTLEPLTTFVYEDGNLVQEQLPLIASVIVKAPEGSMSGLRTLLYSLENLRKRDGLTGEDKADAEKGELQGMETAYQDE